MKRKILIFIISVFVLGTIGVSAAFSGFFEIADGDTHRHSYDKIAILSESTCTVAGVKEYTCSCGESYTAQMYKSAHSFVNDVCSVCGASSVSLMVHCKSHIDYSGAIETQAITHLLPSGSTWNDVMSFENFYLKFTANELGYIVYTLDKYCHGFLMDSKGNYLTVNSSIDAHYFFYDMGNADVSTVDPTLLSTYTLKFMYNGEDLDELEYLEGASVFMPSPSAFYLEFDCDWSSDGELYSPRKRFVVDADHTLEAVYHEHTYVQSILKESTCRVNGIAKLECVCGDSYEALIPRTDHVYLSGYCGNCTVSLIKHYPNWGGAYINSDGSYFSPGDGPYQYVVIKDSIWKDFLIYETPSRYFYVNNCGYVVHVDDNGREYMVAYSSGNSTLFCAESSYVTKYGRYFYMGGIDLSDFDPSDKSIFTVTFQNSPYQMSYNVLEGATLYIPSCMDPLLDDDTAIPSWSCNGVTYYPGDSITVTDNMFFTANLEE